MKNYREIADSVFARRDQYVIAQRKKKNRTYGSRYYDYRIVKGAVWPLAIVYTFCSLLLEYFFNDYFCTGMFKTLWQRRRQICIRI